MRGPGLKVAKLEWFKFEGVDKVAAVVGDTKSTPCYWLNYWHNL